MMMLHEDVVIGLVLVLVVVDTVVDADDAPVAVLKRLRLLA